MTLVIANQLGPDVEAALRAHASAPTIVDPPADAPWEIAASADILLARPGPAWRAARRQDRPAGWPGRIRWIQTGSVGVDAFPSWLLESVPVTCGRGVAAAEVANHVVAALSARTHAFGHIAVRSPDAWRSIARPSLVGAVVAVIGLGAVGRAVAVRMLVMGAQVVAVRRGEAQPTTGVRLLDRLQEAVAAADHIILCVPGVPQNDRLIDAAILRHARPWAHIVNVARGSVIDQDALIAALDAEQIAFATLDVATPEPLPEGHRLYTHPRVLLTPHIASNHLAGQPLLAAKVIANLDRFLAGRPLLDVIDPRKGY